VSPYIPEDEKQGYTTSPLTEMTVLLPHGSVKVGSGAIICRDGGEMKVILEIQVQMWWATEPATLARLRCVDQANIQT